MTLWLLFAALTLTVVIVLVVPLLRRQTAAPQRAGYDLAVFRDQLAELDRDRDRGVLTDDQAAAARVEVQRRILAADTADQPEADDPKRLETGRWLRLTAAMLILAGLPAGALALYISLGSPNLPAQPFAARANSPQFKITALAEQLAARLKAQPDPKGYVLLGETLGKLGRQSESADAYRQAVQLGAADAATLAALGEALVLANQGAVVPDARQAFLQALAADAADPRARYYLGLAQAQIGNAREALAIWRQLEQSSPADASWLPMLRDRIEGLGKDAKIDPATVPPQAPSTAGVTAPANTAAAPRLDQNQQINAMVDGLAAKMAKDPGNLEGWLKLARAYRVLGQLDKARAAADRAVALKPDAVEPRLVLAEVQMAAAPGGEDLPADFIATMRQVLTMDANNDQALYYVGGAEAQAGHAAEARRLWSQLLAKLPADAPERIDLTKMLASLPAK